jgi:hypothetical protein
MSVAIPSIESVAQDVGVDPADSRFVEIYNTAVHNQARDCDVSDYTEDLAEALYRRVNRLWSSKAHSLGVLDTGPDYGVQYVPRYDPILDELEAPYRYERTVIA